MRISFLNGYTFYLIQSEAFCLRKIRVGGERGSNESPRISETTEATVMKTCPVIVPVETCQKSKFFCKCGFRHHNKVIKK